MAYGNRVTTDDITAPYTDEVYALGAVYVQPADEVVAAVHTDGTTSLGLQGPRTWVFVRASVALQTYDCCTQFDETVVNSRFRVKPVDAVADNPLLVMGVAQNAIAINNYGWIVCQGQVVVKGNGGITAGQLLDTHGTPNGAVDDSTVVGTLIGIALTATGAPAANLIAADIRLG